MTYEIRLDERAIKFLEKSPRVIRERILEKIEITESHPLHFFEKLEAKNLFKLRVGNYRVIATINKKERIVKVVLIGHRKNIYQKI